MMQHLSDVPMITVRVMGRQKTTATIQETIAVGRDLNAHASTLHEPIRPTRDQLTKVDSVLKDLVQA